MEGNTPARRCKAGQLALITAPWPLQSRMVRILRATTPEAPFYLRSPWLVESLGGQISGMDRNCEAGAGSLIQCEDRWLLPLGEEGAGVERAASAALATAAA